MNVHRPRWFARAALLLGALLVLAACGTGPDAEDSPDDALGSALANFAEWDGVTAVFSLDSDPASLAAASEGDLTQDQAEQLLRAALSLSVVEGADPTDSKLDLAVQLDGVEVAQMRAVGEVLFLRVDLDEVAGDVPDMDVAELRMGLGFFGAPGQALAAGEWVSIDAREAAGAMGQEVPEPDPADEVAIEEIQRELLAALQTEGEVTFVESDSVGDRLLVTVDAVPIMESLIENAESLTAAGGQDVDMMMRDLPPSIPITLDVWVDNDQIKQIRLDIVQLAESAPDGSDIPAGVENLGLLIALEEFTGSIDAPEGAVHVDLEELFGGMFGGFGGPGFDDDFGFDEEFEDGGFEEFEEFDDAFLDDMCAEFADDPLFADDPQIIEMCGLDG